MARDAAKPAIYDFSLLLLRLVLGAVFIVHGGQKVLGWLDGPGMGGYAAVEEVQQLQGAERQETVENLRKLSVEERRQKLADAAGNDGAGFVNQVAGKQIHIPFTGISYAMPYPELAAYIAAYSEFAGGIIVVLGFLTRLGALAIFGVMVGAILTTHHHAFLLFRGGELQGGMEYALTLAVVALALVLSGGGNYSLWGILTGRCCRSKKQEEQQEAESREDDAASALEEQHESQRPDMPPREPYRPDLG